NLKHRFNIANDNRYRQINYQTTLDIENQASLKNTFTFLSLGFVGAVISLESYDYLGAPLARDCSRPRTT
ncbi:hypothetical protein N9J26_00465, partial [bacterium]|nr:hypothetical protein [bacterium]